MLQQRSAGASSSSSACKWQLACSLAAPACSLAECSGSLSGSPVHHHPPCLALPVHLLLPTDYTVAAPFDLGQCIDPYCSIWRMDRDGTNRQRVARNVRNAAGYTWHPSTGELLFAGMERDGMGNNGGCSAGKGGFTADAAVLLLLACWMAGWNWCPGLTEPRTKPAAAPDDVLAAIRIDDAAISSGSITNFEWPVCHWCAAAVAAMRSLLRDAVVRRSGAAWLTG